MKVVDYDTFVRKTDQYTERSAQDRQRIALYGLVGEIGSLVSAVKKQILASDREQSRHSPTEEIIEELGDIIWYCFSAVQIFFPAGNTNIFNSEIAFLNRMLTSSEEQWVEFRRLLGEEKREAFLEAVKSFPSTQDLRFSDFQILAFKTARTDGATLLQVCLSVLWQLGAEILRHTIPETERAINTRVVDRKLTYVLGDVAWHVSAIATIYGLSLCDVVSKNIEKITLRQPIQSPTPLHDDGYPEDQRFPRRFSVSFISVSPRRSRMYLDGQRLGDDLTDNAYDPDGYRFHDIMHLANVAKLGWSPVLRSLLKRKRKRDPKVDEVEDGARARIVEEAVVKAIHSEGVRVASERQFGPRHPDQPEIFPDADEISFSFLKFIRTITENLEVKNNTYWEWEQAILAGYQIFHELCKNGSGTVTVDLIERSICYDPIVYVDFSGPVGGLGAAIVKIRGTRTLINPIGRRRSRDEEIARHNCVKEAILGSLGLDADDPTNTDNLDIRILDAGRVAVSASGNVEKRIWELAIVCFRATVSKIDNQFIANVVAIADPL